MFAIVSSYHKIFFTVSNTRLLEISSVWYFIEWRMCISAGHALSKMCIGGRPFKNFHSVEISDPFDKIMHFIMECIIIESFDCKPRHVSLNHLVQWVFSEPTEVESISGWIVEICSWKSMLESTSSRIFLQLNWIKFPIFSVLKQHIQIF